MYLRGGGVYLYAKKKEKVITIILRWNHKNVFLLKNISISHSISLFNWLLYDRTLEFCPCPVFIWTSILSLPAKRHQGTQFCCCSPKTRVYLYLCSKTPQWAPRSDAKVKPTKPRPLSTVAMISSCASMMNHWSPALPSLRTPRYFISLQSEKRFHSKKESTPPPTQFRHCYQR